MPNDPIGEVIQANTDWIMSLGGVVGLGQGRCDDADCIVVFADSLTPDVAALPDTLDGYPLRIEATGQVTAPPK